MGHKRKTKTSEVDKGGAAAMVALREVANYEYPVLAELFDRSKSTVHGVVKHAMRRRRRRGRFYGLISGLIIKRTHLQYNTGISKVGHVQVDLTW